MHELSIVQNILEIATHEVQKASATKVEQIDLDIGMLSGIEMDAFLFAWKACVPDTILEHAERVINRIEGNAACSQCNFKFPTEDYFTQCPECGDYLAEIIQGKELKIKSMVIS